MTKIILLTQLPPPNNGATFMNSVACETISENFLTKKMDLSLSENVQESNRLSIKKIFKLMMNYLRLIASLLCERYDLCYFTITPTGMSFIKDSFLVLILRFFNVRVIYHLHGNGVKKCYGGIYKFFYNYVFSGENVIVLSKSLSADVDFIKGVNVHVLNNFCSLTPRPYFGDESKKFKIGYLSNLRREKGVFELITLAIELAKGTLDFKIVVAGPWSRKKDHDDFFFSPLLSDELMSRFEFVGEVNTEQKEDFFNYIDIFFFPSFIDTFPLVLLESISFGKPILCSDVGGMADIAETCKGFVFSHSDTDKYKKICLEIERLIDIKYYKSKSDACINAYLTIYTKSKFESELVNIIYSVLRKEG